MFSAVCRHGLSRTDYHIQYDPQLSFRKFVRERRGRTARQAAAAAADLSAANMSVKGSLLHHFPVTSAEQYRNHSYVVLCEYSKF